MWEAASPAQWRAGEGGRPGIVPCRREMKRMALRFGLSSGLEENVRRGAARWPWEQMPVN